MKKAGFNEKKNNDSTILIVIGVIVVAFIFGLKPLYQTIVKLQNGTLFEKKENETKDEDEENKNVPYTYLEPVGASKLVCKNILSNAGGDKTTQITLYYTNNQLKSIKEDISYSGITAEYANYILSEQSRFKQRRNTNIENKGYSVEIELVSTNDLKVSSVYLLEKTDLEDIILTTDEKIDVIGTFNEDIYEVSNKYINNNYTCEW